MASLTHLATGSASACTKKRMRPRMCLVTQQATLGWVTWWCPGSKRSHAVSLARGLSHPCSARVPGHESSPDGGIGEIKGTSEWEDVQDHVDQGPAHTDPQTGPGLRYGLGSRLPPAKQRTAERITQDPVQVRRGEGDTKGSLLAMLSGSGIY